MTIAAARTDRSGSGVHRGAWPRGWWSAAALLLALGLGGCVSGPDGVLAPVAPVAGAGRVDMIAVTTRDPAPDPGALFTGARAEQVSALRMLISIPSDRTRKIGEVEWPKALPPDPASAFAALQVQPLDAQGLRAWFATRPDAGGRVLVFVHGFNTDFETAVFRLAQIAHDSCAAVAPVLFSWPSRGSLIAGDTQRLGAVDPSVEPNRSRLEAVGIAVYDLTALRAADTLAHSKFADSPEMVRLLGSRLIGGQKLSDSRNGLGEQLGAVAAGAARTAGSAAGVLLSAPAAIVDPGARSSGQERIGEFGRNLGGVVRVLQPGGAAATLPAYPSAPRN